MSTDQPQLSDFESARSLHEEALDGVGAHYHGQHTSKPRASAHGAEGVCLNCGHELPPHVARVVGDNDGCVRACKQCRSDFLDDEDLQRGNFSTTVAIVHKLRSLERGGLIDPNGGGRQ